MPEDWSGQEEREANEAMLYVLPPILIVLYLIYLFT